MCGIVGMVCPHKGGFSSKMMDALKDLTHVTSLRGKDATGMFYVMNNGDVQVHKGSLTSTDFVETDEWKAASKDLISNGHAAVVHCRAATKGGKDDENAHPFQVGHIVLVHNGTLTNAYDLEKTDVDSHAIAHKLAEEDDIPTALQSLQGAYALIWYNLKTKKLHAVRNNERPLFLTWMKDDTVMFASEPTFLNLAGYRNSFTWDRKAYPVAYNSGELMTIDLTKHKENIDFDNIDIAYRRPPFRQITTTTTQGAEIHALPAPSTKPTQGAYRSPTAITPATGAVACNFGEVIAPVTEGIAGFSVDKNWFRKLFQRGEKVLIEACDYIRVDDADLSCNNFYVYGKVIDKKNPEKDSFPVYWEVICESEEEVLEYSQAKFYEAKAEWPISREDYIKNTLTALWKVENIKELKSVTTDVM